MRVLVVVNPHATAITDRERDVLLNALSSEDALEVPETAKENARFVLIGGQVLDQKVVQYGPFVLNTPEEVRQTLMDYQFHMNGFERAEGWQSEIGKSMVH